jgi:hypothetical protein
VAISAIVIARVRFGVTPVQMGGIDAGWGVAVMAGKITSRRPKTRIDLQDFTMDLPPPEDAVTTPNYE